MIGAVTGDNVGSGYESYRGIPDRDFTLFKSEQEALTFLDVSRMTDDSMLTLAVAEYMNDDSLEVHESFRKWYEEYPDAGYGNWFCNLAESDQIDGYNSYGNGAAMRISPVPYYFSDPGEMYSCTKKVTEATHDHQEGIRGALATTTSIWYALTGEDKDSIKENAEEFGYNIDFYYHSLQKEDATKPICQITVPRAIFCFLESDDYESAIRNAICIGGDTDTTASITGGIAEAYYGGVPDKILQKTVSYFDEYQMEVLKNFLDNTGNIYNYEVV